MERKVAVAALAGALASTSSLCYAQTAETTPSATSEAAESLAATGDAIIVTGIRESLRRGIDVKRESVQIVDSIVAEDIGRLPDQNVAESLGRVSGVQIRRGIDEASDISIRGLRQNRLEFNGRTLISPYGRGADGPDDGAYNVLTLIPSELISRLDVTKLPSAAMIEGSLGGTVNILTRRPTLDRDLFIGGSFELVYKDEAEDFSYRGTALASKSFFNGTLGLSLGVNYQELNIAQDSTDSFTGWRPVPNSFSPTPAVRDPNGDGINVYYYNDIRYQRLEEKRRKFGITGGLQWQPAPEIEIYADILYAHAETDRNRRWVSIPLSGSRAAYTQLFVSENENILAGTIRATVQGNGERIALPTDIWTGAVGGTWQASDRLGVRAEVSYTKGSQDYVQSYLRADTRTTTPIAFDFRDVDVPSVSFPSGLDPSDASQFIYRTSFDNLFEYAAEEMAARLDFKYDLDGDFLSSLEFGLRFNEIKSERVTSRDQTVFAASGASAIPVTRHPGNFELVEFDGFLDSASGEFPNAFLLAVPEFGDLAGVCRVFSPDCTPEELDPTSSYTLEEPIYAAYAQANLKSSLFSIPFTGNVGLRYVKTEVNAAGAFGIRGSADPGAFNPVEVDVSYDDWLPSAAFRFELGDEVLLRFGAARVIARPNTTQLSPSFSITTSGGGSGGNPALEPFRVNQFDVSFEWYPTRSTVLALSLFYKDVESFIYTRLVQEVIPGFDADAAAAPADRDEDPETPYRINRTFNGDGAVIKGFEVLVNQPLDFLPSPFDGFGVNATYTYIHSKSGIVDPRLGTDLSIEGLSNHNVNLVGYYEKGPFGIRVAYNWRSEYLDKIGIGGDGVYFEAYDNVSASINYKITDNVTFSLQGANLTSSPVRKYGGYEEATNTYLENGRTFTAALRFRF